MRYKRLVALLITIPLSLVIGVGIARATLPNSWVWLRTSLYIGVRAQLAIGDSSTNNGGTQNIYVSVGGSASLDIVQLGVRTLSNGSRVLFAGWGKGEPNAIGSLYEERYFGSVNRSWHTYELVLINGSWRMTIDGVIVLRVPDTFRNWTIQSTKIAVEAEYPNTLLGGTITLPQRAQLSRVWSGNSWILPTWYMGGYAIPPETQTDFGADWFKVWR